MYALDKRTYKQYPRDIIVGDAPEAYRVHVKFGYTQSHPHQNSIELRKTHSAFPIAIVSPVGVRSCISTVTKLQSMHVQYTCV